MEEYKKKPLKIDEQIELLERRGVKISDKQYLSKFLSNVNYYKFTAYLKSYELKNDLFNCEVEKVIKLYEFDRLLRLNFFEALSIIEILLKTKIVYEISLKYGGFGHYCLVNFKKKHEYWLQKINKSLHKEKKDDSNNIISTFFKETFLKYYRKKYTNYPNTPIWMFVELISFGETSKFFSNMRFNDQIKISKYFISDKIKDPQFARNLFHILSITRNICAHNGRLWNKEFNLRFSQDGLENTELSSCRLNPIKSGVLLLLMNYVLRRCYFDAEFFDSWRKRIENLLDSRPEAPDFMKNIGLPENWKEHPLWKD